MIFHGITSSPDDRIREGLSMQGLYHQIVDLLRLVSVAPESVPSCEALPDADQTGSNRRT